MIQDYLEIGRQRKAEHDQRQREGLLKIEHDVEIARDIQLNFLPSQYPQPEGWDVAACFHPARQVAGDWYDAFYMANKRRVGFLVADVCDKGVGSALFMALFRSLIRAFAQQNFAMRWMDTSSDDWSIGDLSSKHKAVPSTGTTALKNAVEITNNYMCENHIQLNYFATMFFGMLNPTNGEISYINAGHPPAFVVNKSGGVRERLKGTGPAVGIFPGVEFNIGETFLEPGEMLLTYSDGVTDARHPSGERYGEKRLLSLLETPAETAYDLLTRIEGELRAHIAGADQFDDITMMSVFYKTIDSKSEIER
jgi:sigma-B regulation protein RsbU (phosphoserine phosphatase)